MPYFNCNYFDFCLYLIFSYFILFASWLTTQSFREIEDCVPIRILIASSGFEFNFHSNCLSCVISWRNLKLEVSSNFVVASVFLKNMLVNGSVYSSFYGGHNSFHKSIVTVSRHERYSKVIDSCQFPLLRIILNFRQIILFFFCWNKMSTAYGL